MTSPIVRGFIFCLLLIILGAPLKTNALQLIKEPENTNSPHFITMRLSLIDAIKNVVRVSGSWIAFRPFELNGGILNAEKGLELFSDKYRKGYFFNCGLAVPWHSAVYSQTNNHLREIIFTIGYLYIETLQKSIISAPVVTRESHALSLLAGLEITRWLNKKVGLQIHVHAGAHYYVSKAPKHTVEPALELSAGISL